MLATRVKQQDRELCIPLTRYEALFSPIVSRAFSSIARFHWGGTPNRYTAPTIKATTAARTDRYVLAAILLIGFDSFENSLEIVVLLSLSKLFCLSDSTTIDFLGTLV